jgi:hypothetical protein
MSDPYALFEAYARQEQELLAWGRLEEIAELGAKFQALAATLPAEPPASARPALEAARSVVASNVALVEARLAEIRSDLSRLACERRTRATYYSTQPAPSVDAQG